MERKEVGRIISARQPPQILSQENGGAWEDIFQNWDPFPILNWTG